jgi:hypothetical protein
LQEGDRGAGALVRDDFCVYEPAVVVDGDVDELPTGDAAGTLRDRSDGTRTRDLRRDRLVPPIRRLATIGALSLYSCGSAGFQR